MATVILDLMAYGMVGVIKVIMVEIMGHFHYRVRRSPTLAEWLTLMMFGGVKCPDRTCCYRRNTTA